MLFTPIATLEELEDACSWINTSYTYPAEAYKNYFSAYGEALAAWAKVESKICAIYTFCLKSPESKAVLSGFYSLGGFRAKLNLTDSCIQNNESVTIDLECWKNLHKKCIKKSKNRNFLAHGVTYYDHVKAKEHRRFFLSNGDGIESRMYESDIVAVRDSFLELAEELTGFWFSLQKE